MGTVLNYRNATGVCLRQDFLHTASEAGVVDGDDRFRARPYPGRDRGGIHGQIVLADRLAKTDFGAQGSRGVRRWRRRSA